MTPTGVQLQHQVKGAATSEVRYLSTAERNVVWVDVDPTVHKGALSAEASGVIANAASTARNQRLPLVMSIASSGADILGGIAALHGWGQAARALAECSGVVPTITIVTGPAVSGPALLIGLADFVIMTRDSYAFVSGPTMVAEFTGVTISHDELGGTDAHAKQSGVASLVVDDVDAAREALEHLLTYLPDNVDETARIVAYEMNGLFNDTEASVAMMDYLFYRIRDSLDGSVPCLIYLEEAWHLIREPRFMRKVDDWLRTFRKLNAPVWMATQSLAEVQSSDLFVPILDMVPNKVFLPNPAAHLSAELYGKFGLNDSHLADLAQMTPKREYLLITPGATRRVACDLPPQVVSCLTSSPPAQAALTRARAGNAPDWVERYLKEMAHA